MRAGVRLSRVIPSWLCFFGLLVAVAGVWMTTTAPGNLEAMAWERRKSVQTGTGMLVLGGFTALCAACYCTWLVLEGGYRLWRYSDSNRRARWIELAWNAAGAATTFAAIAVAFASSY